jgi:aquaporin related protein
MATYGTSPLPHYHGQQLEDGTTLGSPVVPRHERVSSDSRHELLRLPVQPHPAYLDPNLDPVSPSFLPQDSTAVVPVRSERRLGASGFGDVSEYNTPSRQRRRTQSQDIRPANNPLVHRRPYVEDYPSDEEYDPQPYRRRPSRQHRPPPSTYENDPRAMSRYAPLPGRNSVEGRTSYNNDKPRYHYTSEEEYHNTPRRPGHSVNGNGPPRSPPSVEHVMRLPWMIWMGSSAKNHFVAFVGEFVGTTMFLFFAFSGTQVANIGSSAGGENSNTTTGEATGFSPNVLLYIALVFSFSLMVNVWVFFRISGGLFNPAVTFAMLLCRALSPTRAFLLLAAQIAGSIFSSFLVSVLFPTPFNVRTTLSTGTSLAQGVFIEAILTAELVFTIFMLAKEKHKGM